MARRNRKPKKSVAFPVPAVTGTTPIVSRALRVGKSQRAEANRVAQEMGCGTPFGDDGMFRASGRPGLKQYMREINLRRADQGEPRFVNLDGEYGDEI